MPERSLPSIDLTPSVPENATPQQCIALWLDLLDTCDQFLLAGLRREIGPNGDLHAAYAKWYGQQMEEHDRVLQRMVDWFNRIGGVDAP